MDISGYYDLATKRFVSALESNSSVQIPPITAGEDITIRAKFRQTREGLADEIRPTVVAMRAVLGEVDQRPATGTIKLDVDGVEFSEAIAYDSTAPEDFEEALATALVALAGITTVTVDYVQGSYFVIFDDDPTIERTIVVTENTLFPTSFLRIRSFIRSGKYIYEFRFVKAPVGFSNTFSLGVGPIPTITVLREGGSIGETFWSEIQKLVVPPSFTGTFRIKRGEVRSDPLGSTSTLDEIQVAMEKLADAGGVFGVSSPIENNYYLSFDGDMSGIDQELMTVEIFDSPPPENVITFSTKTREMADLMMSYDQKALVLEVYAQLEDLEVENENKWHCLLRVPINVKEAVDWEELSTAPAIDWLNPPTLLRTRVFSPGQTSNGQIHYNELIGDGAGTSFEITHGLSTPFVDVIILENTTPGDKMVEGTDYTWTRDNDDQVTITWLGTTPTEDQYTVTILGLAQTSFFDAHTHTIADIDGLQEWIDSAEERFASLLASSAKGIGRELAATDGESARWTLPSLWELYPSRYQPTKTEGGVLSTIDLTEVGENGRKIFDRGRGMLPAIHDASAEALPVPVPTASDTYAGKLYQNQSGASVVLPAGRGLRSLTIADDEYAACDGFVWYPVVPYGRWGSAAFTSDYAEDATLFTFTDELAEQLEVGRTVEVSSTGTLPTGLASGTPYVIKTVDYVTRQFTLATSLSADPIEVSADGSGVHSLLIEDDITWYPKHFERTIATVSVNDKQLRAGKDFYLAFSIEAALLQATLDAQIGVTIEFGEARGVDTIGTENDNLEEIVWRKIPALEQIIVLSNVSTTHTFGVRVSRRKLSGVETMSAVRMLYGAEETGVVPPRTGNFLARIRLTKFDTSDGSTDPKGLLMLSGLKIGDSQEIKKVGEYEIGFAIVK